MTKVYTHTGKNRSQFYIIESDRYYQIRFVVKDGSIYLYGVTQFEFEQNTNSSLINEKCIECMMKINFDSYLSFRSFFIHDENNDYCEFERKRKQDFYGKIDFASNINSIYEILKQEDNMDSKKGNFLKSILRMLLKQTMLEKEIDHNELQLFINLLSMLCSQQELMMIYDSIPKKHQHMICVDDKHMKNSLFHKGILEKLKRCKNINIEVAVSEHHGYMKPTEDRHTILFHDKFVILAVFDGHQGSMVSNFVNTVLPNNIYRKILPVLDNYNLIDRVRGILYEEFLNIKNQIPENVRGGSTATVAVVFHDHIVTAHIGDSPCILFNIKTGRLLKFTTDHDCGNSTERTRVEECGNPCLYDKNKKEHRLSSGLMPTRGFGDHMHKCVIPTPDIEVWNIDTTGLCLCVMSDSFYEKRDGRLIRPLLTHYDIVKELQESIMNTSNVQNATHLAVQKRVDKFKHNEIFYGDNTTLIMAYL